MSTNIDQQDLREALRKVLKKGIAFDIECYDRKFLAKECVKEINKNLLCEGYSASLKDSIYIEIYNIGKKDVLTTIEIGSKGIEFEKGLSADWAAAISPVVRIMMETIKELIEN